MPPPNAFQLAHWPNRHTLVKIGSVLFCLFIVLAAHSQDDPNSEQSDSAAPMPSASTPSPRPAPDIDAQKRALLREQYPQEDLRKLDSDTGESFNALWRKDQTGDAFGAVLIVPDNGQTANWPHTIDVLRLDLPNHGWSTLSIDLVEKKPRVFSKNREQADTNDDAIYQNNLARMQAALTFLNSEGQYNIVAVGYGESAVRLIDFMTTLSPSSPAMPGNSKKTGPVRALVLINARNTIDDIQDTAFDKLVWRDVPVLDVFFGTHFRDPFEISNRRKAAKKNRLSTYYQLKLLEPSSTVFAGENRLSRRIRGFLNNNAKGVEIERGNAR
jgi:hypothetical protein